MLFGTDYFLEIVDDGGRVSFLLGSHHEAFKADASEAKGHLQKYIKEIMERHPESVFEEAVNKSHRNFREQSRSRS